MVFDCPPLVTGLDAVQDGRWLVELGAEGEGQNDGFFQRGYPRLARMSRGTEANHGESGQ